MITSETAIRVRYAETDAMTFVHHKNYLVWFEMARIEMMDRLGLSYKKLEESGNLMPVLGVTIDYLQPAFFDDQLIIKVSINEKPLVRLTCHYEVFRGETMISRGTSKHAFTNRQGQPIKPPTEYKELMSKHFL